MEWLSLLASQPQALASFHAWLKLKERECAEHALDVPESERQSLKGKRDSFRDIQAYINNNLKHAQTSTLGS